MYLYLEKISKKYGEKIVLNNIDFDIEQGELLCVLGPSGCGKTTLLNIIGGFIEDFSGNIILADENISNLPPEKRPIATVFQSYGLFPHKNVIENVSYGLKFLKLSKEESLQQAKNVLEKVGLSGYENKKIEELSGGQQQRVALARSLVLNPKMLLLDEPFSNLDVHLRDIMRDEVKRIQKEFGVTMIVVTHDQEDAFRLADKIVVLNEGEIEQIGSPRELYLNPKSNFVAKFIGDSNILDSEEILRPEDVKLVKNNEAENIIVEKTFFGSIVEYRVKTTKYGILKAVTLSSEAEFELGDKVEVKLKK